MRKLTGPLVAVACAILTVALIVAGKSAGSRTPAAVTATAGRNPAATASALRVGVVTDNLQNFQKATGVMPSIQVKYEQWGSTFPRAAVLADHGLGVTVMIVLEPGHVNFTSIMSGKYDAYLASWGAAEGNLGYPVILSFAPEANGPWYTWGQGHVPPALYRQAWQRVHDDITKAGARSVTWLWQVNCVWRGSQPLATLWPGSAYVNEVGIDGQLATAADTFTSVFAQSVTQVRAITGDPLVISEVSVSNDKSRPAQITGLFAGASRDRLSALILFDVYPRWQIEDDPATLAAFRAASRKYQ